MGVYTGHRDRLINKQNLVDAILPTIKDEALTYGGIPVPSREQIALVVSALRNHNILIYASEYDFSDVENPNKPTDFYPIQTSIGRFFRDSARNALREYKSDVGDINDTNMLFEELDEQLLDIRFKLKRIVRERLEVEDDEFHRIQVEKVLKWLTLHAEDISIIDSKKRGKHGEIL